MEEETTSGNISQTRDLSFSRARDASFAKSRDSSFFRSPELRHSSQVANSAEPTTARYSTYVQNNQDISQSRDTSFASSRDASFFQPPNTRSSIQDNQDISQSRDTSFAILDARLRASTTAPKLTESLAALSMEDSSGNKDSRTQEIRIEVGQGTFVSSSKSPASITNRNDTLSFHLGDPIRAKEFLNAPGSVETLVKVYLMDNSYKAFKIDIAETCVEELWEIMSEKLGLSVASAPLFFIYGVRGDLELLLYTHQMIKDVYRDWKIFEDRYNPEERETISRTLNRTFSMKKTKSLSRGNSFHNENPKSFPDAIKEPIHLVFRTTSVVPLKDEMRQTDHGAINLFYIQAVYNVISSNYPCTLEMAIKLAGIQLQLTLGNRNPDLHRVGYLQEYIPQYIPEHLIPKMKPEGFEELLFAEHDLHANKTRPSLQQMYLDVVRKWPHYGAVFFKAKYVQQDSIYKQQFEGKVRIGINGNGVHVVDPKEMRIHAYTYADIIDFNSEKSLFYFTAQNDDASHHIFQSAQKHHKTFQFVSKQAELINDLICDWYGQIEQEGKNTEDKEKKKKKKKKKSDK